MLDGAYVFPLALTDERKAQIQARARQQLTEMLGVEVDNVMAEYVIVMVGNKKNMTQIAHDLVDFIGDESAQQFAEWLSDMLKGLEAEEKQQQQPAEPAKLSESAPVADESKKEPKEEPKRVVSLKGSSSTDGKKLVSLTSSRGSIRSLNSSSKDSADVLARRSQRFGVVEKPQQKQRENKAQQSEQKRDDSRAAGSKRKAGGDKNSEAPRSGRLAQLLGPPVNVDQAELDARDSLNTNKKSKRGRSAERPQQGGRDKRDRDEKGNDRPLKRKNDDSNSGSNKRRQEDKNSRESRGGNVAPPLPPPDNDDRKDKFGPNGRGGPQMGMFNGPPGYGGFPPYGGPMFYPPPGFAPPPYGMGFPPHGMPPQYGQFPPQGHHPRPSGGRAPRPFQNRTWVNPNIAKKEETDNTEGENNAAGGSENTSAASGSGLNPNAQTFAPRNPYYSSQMRPRFQNKTWVRQDIAKEEELSSSLPKTPPQESMES